MLHKIIITDEVHKQIIQIGAKQRIITYSQCIQHAIDALEEIELTHGAPTVEHIKQHDSFGVVVLK